MTPTPIAEKVIIWVKWAPNLALRLSAPFAPTLDKGLIQNPCRPGWVPIWASLELWYREIVLDSHASPSLLPFDFSVQQRPHGPEPQPVSETRWPLPYRLPRFSSAAYLTRSRSSRHSSPALQSQGGQDNTESQTV